MVFVPSIVTFLEESKIKMYLEKNELPTFKHNGQKSRFIKKCSKFISENGLLYLKKGAKLVKVVCEQDTARIKVILDVFHTTNHHGEKKMRYSLAQEYAGIKISVLREYLANCDQCQHYQALKTNDVIKNIRASKSFERLQIDLVDLRKFSSINDGYNWILNVLDVFSKYLFSFELKDKSANEVTFSLFELIFRFVLFLNHFLRLKVHQK